MNIRATFCAASCFVAAAALRGQATAAPASQPATVDVSSIAGDYAIVTANQAMTNMPPEMMAKTRIRIGDGKLTITVAGAPVGTANVVSIDPTASPHTIEMVEAAGAGAHNAGIYKLDGDTLTLATRTDGVRPDSFEPGTGVMLVVLKRGAAGAAGAAGATTRP